MYRLSHTLRSMPRFMALDIKCRMPDNKVLMLCRTMKYKSLNHGVLTSILVHVMMTVGQICGSVA